MNNLRDMYYLFQLIVQQIFVFLRDIIVHEFPRFISYSKQEEVDETGHSRIRAPSPMKHTLTDFGVSFIVGLFLVLFVILSTKKSDDYIGKQGSNERTITMDPIYHFPRNWTTKTAKCPHDRGDEYFSEEDDSPREETCFEKDNKSRKHSSTSSFSETHSDSSQYSQRRKNRKRSMKNITKDQHWLIRKTRSGHIYGKYPI